MTGSVFSLSLNSPFFSVTVAMKRLRLFWYFMSAALTVGLCASSYVAWLESAHMVSLSYWLPVLLALATGGAWTYSLIIYRRPRKEALAQHDKDQDVDNGDDLNTESYFWKFAMNSVTDFFYAKDLQGRYLGQNKALLDLYSHKSEKAVIGKTNAELYPDMDKDAVHKLEEIDIRAAYSPFPLIVEEYVPSINGELRVCESVKCSYRSPEGAVLGMICVSRDITSRKQIEMALLKSQTETQAASQAKSAFLANTSHEIRTPLNGILGLLFLAKQTELNERQQDLLQKTSDCAGHLLNVVNDILDFSKVEVGKLTLDVAPLSLHDVFQQVIEFSSVPAKQAGVDVIFKFDPRIPKTLMGDSKRLKQILTNLMGNAVKFTHEGSIRVSCVLQERTHDMVRVSVTVSDTGIGISESQISTLFKAFSQGDVSRTRQYGGTGLGLAISKELVSLMGGVINVESHQGEGSAFSFSILLGLAPADVTEIVEKPTAQPSERLKGQRVLLVEDNVINRLIARELLEQCEIIVDEAQNGEEALEMIRQNPYDLVLMDIQMPLMDGLTATRYIREDPRFDRLPIIAMTAHAMKADYQESLAAGMQEHVTKPINPELLYETILRWVKPE